MKRVTTIITLCLALLLVLGSAAYAEMNKIDLKFGSFVPTGDLDDDDWDNGTGGEVAYTFMPVPEFGVQGSLGWHRTEIDEGSTDATLDIVPATVSAVGIFNANKFHLYGGGGIGYYFAELDADLGIISDKDDDSVFGYHLMAGLEYDITNLFYIGAEAKWMWTDEAEFKLEDQGLQTDYKADLDGNLYMGKIGFRF